MDENVDEKFMRRCLGLASSAEGMTYPNPLVGSVVVSSGEIIGEGFHQKTGLPHAEVNAINSVKDKTKLKRSTLYVNLEPCSHFGKTPPCADLIIENKIPRVVIGAADTSWKVSGSGIARLSAAGCEVITGVLEKESRWINRRFFTSVEKNRPWIILKWAQSADGFIDIMRTGTTPAWPTWISGKPERALVHRWRSYEQSILVGAGTVRADNPRLNVREWAGRDPLRLVLSSSGKSMPDQADGKWVVFTHNSETVHADSGFVKLDKSQESCIQILEYLQSKGLQSLFVEGGSQVLNHFITNGLWDEARIFTGRDYFRQGIKAPVVRGTLISQVIFSGSLLQVYSNEAVK